MQKITVLLIKCCFIPSNQELEQSTIREIKRGRKGFQINYLMITYEW